MNTNKGKKDSTVSFGKGERKTHAFSSGITRMKISEDKFVVVDSKEFEKEGKSLLV